MTFNLYQFVNSERETDDEINYGRKLHIKFKTKKTIFNDMSVFNEIGSISVVHNGSELIKIFEINENNEITPSRDLFKTIELFYKKYDTDIFFTLVYLIDLIIKSNKIYLHHKCVTSKSDPLIPLDYNQACDAYSRYISHKSNTNRYKLSEELNVPHVR